MGVPQPHTRGRHIGLIRAIIPPTPMPPSDADRESTLSLLERGRAGDQRALDELFARYAPPLRRWASGRLPRWARDLADTPDLVQETLLQTFRNIDGFEHRGEGAFQAYLRQAVMNRIRDELRRTQSTAPNRPSSIPSCRTRPRRRSNWRLAPRRSSATRARSIGCARRNAS